MKGVENGHNYTCLPLFSTPWFMSVLTLKHLGVCTARLLNMNVNIYTFKQDHTQFHVLCLFKSLGYWMCVRDNTYLLMLDVPAVSLSALRSPAHHSPAEPCSFGSVSAEYTSDSGVSIEVRSLGGSTLTPQAGKTGQPGCLSSPFSTLGGVSGRTGSVMSGVQCKMEMQASCSKFIKSFKLTAEH